MKSPENSKRGAEAYESILRAKLARGESLDCNPTLDGKTFEDFSEEWFDTYVMVNNKLSEQQSKESILRLHLVPFLGKLELKDITAREVEAFKVAQQRKGFHPKTVNNQLAVLSKLLRCAVEWGELTSCPIIKRLKTPPSKMDYLTEEECGRLLSDRTEPQWHQMAISGVNTGMRLGELLGLCWENVDFERGMVHVRRSMVRGELTSPKNHRARTIPMTERLKGELFPFQKKHGLLFKKANGMPLEPHLAVAAIRRMCKRSGLRRIGWHTLRHTFASHLVMKGVPLRHVQKLLGHSTVNMTERYAHLAPSSLQDAIAVLNGQNQIFGNHTETKVLKAAS